MKGSEIRFCIVLWVKNVNFIHTSYVSVTHMCVYPVYMRIIIANICIYIYIIHIQYTYCTCILYTIVSSSDVYWHACMCVCAYGMLPQKIFTVHWPCIASIHVARSLHVVLGTTTLCPGAREQTGVAHIPQFMQFILLQKLWYVQTSKTVFLASFHNNPGEIHIVTLGDVVPQKESSCITEESKSQIMEEPELFFWGIPLHSVRSSSSVFPNTIRLQFVLFQRLLKSEIYKSGNASDDSGYWQLSKSKLINVMPRVCTMHPA